MKKSCLLCISAYAAISVAICLFSAPMLAATLTDGSVFTGPLSTVDGFEDLSKYDLAQYRDGYSISDALEALPITDVNPAEPMTLNNFTRFGFPGGTTFITPITPISFQFDNDVTQAGALWETGIHTTITLQAFLDGSLVEQASFGSTQCCSTPIFFGFTGIRFDTLTMSGYSTSNPPTPEVFIDNLSYTTVPITPALYLFGSGLLGLIGIAKKKVLN